MKRPATRVRSIYLVREHARTFVQETTPAVTLDVLKDGTITYGVKAVGKTLRDARQQAEREFLALRKYVRAVKTEELTEQMGHSVTAIRAAKGNPS